MIPFLPPPQELKYTADSFSPTNRHQLFLSPCQGEDALQEVLSAAFKTFGIRCDGANSLPRGDGATLVIAVDSKIAKRLSGRVLQGLEEKVSTSTIWRDGPCFSDETTNARRLAAPLKPSQSDEEYLLSITSEGIAIAGRSRRALFWGAQTLAQILEHCRREKQKSLPGVLVREWPTQKVRGVHLDMKYFVAKPQAIEAWLRELASFKLNTVLFEYEDKFPYERYRFLRNESALTATQLQRVLQTARRYHIDTVPLIQSLGHLEYCLKHEQLAHLREMPDILFQLNPFEPKARQFVLEMMDEVLAYHADAEYFHVGGDETWFLGANPQNKPIVERKGETSVYLDHMVPILKQILKAGKRPILWDDMLRESADKCGRVPRETVLGYWDYGPVREDHGQRHMPAALQKYYKLQSKQPKLWPDTLSSFPFFDYYRDKGFDVLAIPCCNYGTLIPDDVHNAPNTLKFAEKAATCDGLGTINSQWASFKIPLDALGYLFALTAYATWLYPPAETTDLDALYSRVVLGDPSGVLLHASRLIAQGVGFRAPTAGRTYNLLHFAVMDSELNFEGGLLERQKKGSQMGDINAERVVQGKLRAMEKIATKPDVLARLSSVEFDLDTALASLQDARPSTVVGRNYRNVLLASAHFKRTRCDTMRVLMKEPSRFKSPRAALRAEMENREELSRTYERTIATADVKYELNLLFAGEMSALQE